MEKLKIDNWDEIENLLGVMITPEFTFICVVVTYQDVLLADIYASKILYNLKFT